jgi:hypothetical protein
LAGAAGALVLQGGFLLMFLASMPALRPPPELGRELDLILPRFRPLPPRPPSQPQGALGSVTVTPPLFLAPPNMPGNALTRPILPAAPGIGTFGQALNGCAPEKYSSLPPDQQARCPRPGAGVAIQEVPNLMGSPSHVKDEAHWQAEWAREKSPVWLPCTGGFINFICLAQKIANGSLTDPRTWPIYETKQLAPGDFYKIEQAYDAWHKEHPAKAAQR